MYTVKLSPDKFHTVQVSNQSWFKQWSFYFQKWFDTLHVHVKLIVTLATHIQSWLPSPFLTCNILVQQALFEYNYKLDASKSTAGSVFGVYLLVCSSASLCFSPSNGTQSLVDPWVNRVIHAPTIYGWIEDATMRFTSFPIPSGGSKDNVVICEGEGAKQDFWWVFFAFPGRISGASTLIRHLILGWPWAFPFLVPLLLPVFPSSTLS